MTTPLPEPAYRRLSDLQSGIDDWYSLDQLKAYGAAEYKRGIEDAMNCYSPDDLANDWMDKIRKLGEIS